MLMKRIMGWCLGLLIAGCTAKDLAPAPLVPVPLKADFTVPSTIVETTEPLPCKNVSTGVRNEWRISSAPTTVYTTADFVFSSAVPGTYTITLTVFNDKNESATTSKSILVGGRYVKEVRVTELNFLQYTGAPWHADGTGPNVYITIDGYQPTVSLYRSATVTNVQPAQIPLAWSLGNSNAVLLSSTQLNVFYIMDQYGNTSQQMDAWVAGTGNSSYADRDATGTGSYVFRNTSKHNSITVFYQIR